MAGPRVFVSRMIQDEALALIAPEAEMVVWPDEFPPPPNVLRESVRDAEGLVTTIMDRVDVEVFDAAPRLKVVSQMAVGVDNIDVAEATRRGIPVGYTPGVLSRATADLAFALIMAAARRVSEAERWVRAGDWKLAFHPRHWLGFDVSGATLGIVGMGNIGREVAKRAQGFEMKVLYCDEVRRDEEERRYGWQHVDLPTLLRSSDFVSLHVPLTSETRRLIGEEQLALMKPTAVLVNTSRGPVVDPQALYYALKERRIAAAALDVTDPEPIPPDDPLLTLDNLVITPHIGSASVASRLGMATLAARNLLAGLRGERLPQCFNPEVYAGKG